MTRPSPADAREQIVRMLGDSLYHTLGLKELLLTERDALERQDADALERTVTDKSRCIQRLQKLENDRAALCEASGFSSGPDQMPAMTEWCDEHKVIANGWAELMSVAAECNQLNLANGAVLRLQQQQAESGLAILRGTAGEQTTYARTGGGSAVRLNLPLAEA